MVGTSTDTLNTVSGEVTHVIDNEQVDNLVLNGRNYMELLTLISGAIMTNPDQFAINTSLSATQQVVNGHRSNQNNMTVDGLGNLDGGANGSLINNVSPDFMQEVKIQTSNFSADYGRSAGVSFGLLDQERHQQFPRQPVRIFPQRRAGCAKLLFAPPRNIQLGAKLQF